MMIRGWTRKRVTKNPFVKPARVPAATAPRAARGPGNPWPSNWPPTTPERAITDPTEMSIAPEISPNVTPIATIAMTEYARPVLRRFRCVQKSGTKRANIDISSTMNTSKA